LTGDAVAAVVAETDFGVEVALGEVRPKVRPNPALSDY
jgi:hypothetical protein